MAAGVRHATPRELGRLIAFAAVSLAVHALTLGVHVPAGAARSASTAPSMRTLHATLVPSVDTAATALADIQAKPAGEQTAGGLDPQNPHGYRGGDPQASRAPMPDKWYTAAELDVRAEPMSEVGFTYPPKLERLVARVEVALFIDERGHVRKARVLAAEPEQLFDEAALNGWRNVRFSPAMRGGVPVKSEKIVLVDFQPDLSLR